LFYSLVGPTKEKMSYNDKVCTQTLREQGLGAKGIIPVSVEVQHC